LSRDCKTRERG